MTRDELVQAAIEALGERLIFTSYFEGEEISTGSVEEVTAIVVDTVLTKLGAVTVAPHRADGRPVHVTSTSVDVHDVSYTATTFFEE